MDFARARRTKLRKLLVHPPIPRGIYLWGGVGRGKSLLMEFFYQALPYKRKRRVHFHAFMREIHESLRGLPDEPDPLVKVATRIQRETRFLCFDEFHVSDIADAMILGRLLDQLFARGVVFMMTSNYPPDGLYPNGLQRHNFLPTIELLNRQLDVIEVDSGVDYRLRTLERIETYRTPADAQTENSLLQDFEALVGGGGHDRPLSLMGRELPVRRRAPGVVWFDFGTLCGGPRSQNDYLELVHHYHTLLLSNESEGGFFEMLTEANKQVQAYPDSALAHRVLSDALLYTELYEDAAASAKKAIDLAPENPRGWNNLAIILKAMGAEEASKRVYAQAIKIAPNDVKLLIEYAEVMDESNGRRPLEALKSALKLLLDGKGLDIESASYSLEAMLVSSFCQAGASELGYEASQQLLKLKPNDSNLWIAKASAALQATKYDDVRPSLSKAFQINPACKDQPVLHEIVCWLELVCIYPVAAQEAFERAYDLGPDNLTADDLAIIEGIIEAICSKDFISDDDRDSLAFYISEMEGVDPDRAGQFKTAIMKRLRNQR